MSSWWKNIALSMGATDGPGPWARRVAKFLGVEDSPGNSWEAKIHNGSPSLQLGDQGSWDKRMVDPASEGSGPSAKQLYDQGNVAGGSEPQIIVGGTFNPPPWTFIDSPAPDQYPGKWLTDDFNDSIQDFSGATSIQFKNISGATGGFILQQKNTTLVESIDLRGLQVISELHLKLDTLTSLRLDDFAVGGGPFTIENCDSLTSLSLPEFLGLEGKGANVSVRDNDQLVSISMPKLSACQNFTVESNPNLTSVDLSALATVAAFTIALSANLVDFPDLPALKEVNGNVDCSSNALSVASVDAILAKLVSLDGTNGTTVFEHNVVLNGGHNEAPSAQGLADKATLEGRGCTVTVTQLLLHHWTFDSGDVSGATVTDVTGNGADGTLIGSPPVSLVTGIVGDQAISVSNDTTGNPATHYMKVPAAQLIKPTSFTLTWWTKNLTVPTFQETLVGVSKVDTTDVSLLLRWSIINHWQLYIPAGPVARYASHTPNGSGTHFFAATYDENAALNWRFYYDGVEQTAAGVANMGSGKPMNWGSDRDLYFLAAPNGANAGVADGCNCIGDDLKLYSRALSSAEIAARFADPTIP